MKISCLLVTMVSIDKQNKNKGKDQCLMSCILSTIRIKALISDKTVDIQSPQIGLNLVCCWRICYVYHPVTASLAMLYRYARSSPMFTPMFTCVYIRLSSQPDLAKDIQSLDVITVRIEKSRSC